MTKPLKFDEHDRGVVIAEVERHLAVTLRRVGRYRKFLQDDAGRSYWIFGGYEDWHGIKADMLKDEQKRPTDGVLVVAKRHRTSIDIFIGKLQPLIDNQRDLAHTQAGDYQFNVVIRGNVMTIKEVPDLTLRKLGAPTEAGPAVDPKLARIQTMLARMSPAERASLLEHLKRDGAA